MVSLVLLSQFLLSAVGSPPPSIDVIGSAGVGVSSVGPSASAQLIGGRGGYWGGASISVGHEIDFIGPADTEYRVAALLGIREATDDGLVLLGVGPAYLWHERSWPEDESQVGLQLHGGYYWMQASPFWVGLVGHSTLFAVDARVGLSFVIGFGGPSK